jgi:hypothetical protein
MQAPAQRDPFRASESRLLLRRREPVMAGGGCLPRAVTRDCECFKSATGQSDNLTKLYMIIIIIIIIISILGFLVNCGSLDGTFT